MTNLNSKLNNDLTLNTTQTLDNTSSYYVDVNNILYTFNISNTPISNFCTTATSITINGNLVPKSSIKEISFGEDYLTVESIPSYFMYNCASLIKANILGFNNVKTINMGFFSGCIKLESLDLTPLSEVIQIGASFLNRCFVLPSINVTSLSKVKSIGNNFLSECHTLTSLDLSPMVELANNLATVENAFLKNCIKLSQLTLPLFTKLTRVNNNFLEGCANLTSIDLSSFNKVTRIGTAFLNLCTKLTSVDLSPLSNITAIPNSFLTGTSITNLDLSSFTKVKTIGNFFVMKSNSLTSIDLSGFNALVSIGNSFLYQCKNLAEIKIGNVNWINKSVTIQYLMDSVPNSADRQINTTSQDLGNTFKSKMNGKISNWTVVANS